MKDLDQKSLKPFRLAFSTAGERKFIRWGLEILVLFNVVAQGLTAVLAFTGMEGVDVLPLAFGSTVALFLLMFFYLRWMFPQLGSKQVLFVIALKELSLFILFSILFMIVVLIYWFTG